MADLEAICPFSAGADHVYWVERASWLAFLNTAPVDGEYLAAGCSGGTSITDRRDAGESGTGFSLSPKRKRTERRGQRARSLSHEARVGTLLEPLAPKPPSQVGTPFDTSAVGVLAAKCRPARGSYATRYSWINISSGNAREAFVFVYEAR
jgi:hypothetical protein